MTGLAYYNLTASDGTTSTAALGQTIEIKGARYVYLKAGEAITAYDCVYFTKTWTAYQTNTGDSGFSTAPKGYAIPQFAVASGEYFWAPTGPFYLREDDSTNFKVNVLASCVTDVVLYATTTDGAVDDAGTYKIQGLAMVATVGGAQTTAACVAYQQLIQTL